MDFIQLLAPKGAMELYAVLLRFPRRQFTINELAKTAGIPFSTTWLLIKKWERAGIVDTGRLGRAVTVRLSSAEPAKFATKLLGSKISPQRLMLDWFKGRIAREKELRGAYLFGSVARGEERLDSDIDIALLTKGKYDSVPLAEEAAERFRAKLVPLLFTKKRELEDFLKRKEAVRLK